MDVAALAQIPPWEWPLDAADRLLNAIRSGRPGDEDRELIIELAGDITVINDDLASTLLDIIRDPAETDSARGTAAISLGPILEDLDEGEPEGFEDESPISEDVHRVIRDTLRDTWRDAGVPKLVRRRVLEASVRALEDWHEAAVRAAWYGDDDEWRLTAVFAMAYVPGFEDEILDALESTNERIRYHAIRAAGDQGVIAAWPHIRRLLRPGTEKSLLLAAIDAAAALRPAEAARVVEPLADTDDPDIADAIEDVLLFADAFEDDEDDDEEEGFGLEWRDR